jgi:MFS family permease
LGFIGLQPGVSRFNGMTLIYVALTGIPFMAFINFIQPIVLEVGLGMPRGNQGAMTANLAVIQELILLALVGPFGALSDRIGRRPVLAVGYLIVAAGFFAYPWATTALALTSIRGFYAIGAAAIVSGYSALLADYPEEKSRGKLIAILGIMNGLGIGLLGFIGGNLPNWLEGSGMDALPASRIALAIVALLCLLSALVAFVGLRDKRPGRVAQRQPLSRLLREGLAAGRNPRVAVAYASAFAARGDVVVVGTYLSLWISQAGIAQGLSPAEAQGRAGLEFAIVAGASLVAAPILGIMNDRINRVAALAIGMLLGTIGYLAFGLQTDPLAQFAIFAALLLGVGQISSILAGQTLISQEADSPIAGSIIGVFSFFGAVGTLIGSWVGGQLFGLWRPGAPFILMGGFNLLICLAAFWVYLGERRQGLDNDDLLASAGANRED